MSGEMMSARHEPDEIRASLAVMPLSECVRALENVLTALERIPLDCSSPLYRPRIETWLSVSRLTSAAREIAALAARIEDAEGPISVAAVIAPPRGSIHLAHANVGLDTAGWPVWTWVHDYVEHPDHAAALAASRSSVAVMLRRIEMIPVDGQRVGPSWRGT